MPVSPSWSFSGLKLHHKSGEASYALALVHRRRWWYYKGAIIPRHGCHFKKLADDAFIQLWDSRQRDCIRTYKQHSDYITDFLWLDDKKQLVATRSVTQILYWDLYIYIPRVYSGDGTLSVVDIRSRKPDLVAQSEDQDDELLSIVAIKGFVSFLSFNLTLKR